MATLAASPSSSRARPTPAVATAPEASHVVAAPPQKPPRERRMNNRNNRRNRSKKNRHVRLAEKLQEFPGYRQCDGDIRRDALDCLQRLLTGWTTALRPHTNNVVKRSRAVLLTFGSYHLGVHSAASDLDVLVMLDAASCSRQDFLQHFPDVLQRCPEISHVHPIPKAYTPVIKFCFRDQLTVDVLFAHLPSNNNSETDDLLSVSLQGDDNCHTNKAASSSESSTMIITDQHLLQQDEVGVRSLNGVRVSQYLLKNCGNVDTFRTVLRAVKLWAVQQGIYSNVLGFLGGINWAIMVAWVCRQSVGMAPEDVLERFFMTFASWRWPTPVLLESLQTTPPEEALPLPVWNRATNPRDALHVMPIITPLYPSMNSSYNVGIPQLRRMQDELVRACQHCRDYDKLFSPSSFFSRHKHFLQATISATSKQDYVEWQRLVESKLRLLILGLETTEVHAWPFAKFFETKCEENYIESTFFLALRFDIWVHNVDLRHLTSDFLHKVNSWTGRKAGMDLKLEHRLDEKLPAYVFAAYQTEGADDDAASKTSDSSTSTAGKSANETLTASGKRSRS